MARYNVDDVMLELGALGVTAAEVEVELSGGLYFDSESYFAEGRGAERRLQHLLEAARDRLATTQRRAALVAGARCEWRFVGGRWVIVGRGLEVGTIVTVARRDGRTSQDLVAQIVHEEAGLVYALPGELR